MTTILVTGHQGYLGPVIVRELRERWPDARLIGVDIGLFAHCLANVSESPERYLDESWNRDVRSLTESDLAGVDAIVHLAAISNDPMGHRFEALTHAVNHQASAELARRARAAGVGHFVFASSCSVYGLAEGEARSESDPLNPLTAYAVSKVRTEEDLAGLANDRFVVTALRFSTACGYSPRVRCDLVLNDLVYSALSQGEVQVLSDGSPWRPLIEVRDMARAVAWACRRPQHNGGSFVAVNVGADEWNYQVIELANAVLEALPASRLALNPDGQPDKRSYRVDFALFRALAPDHQPQVTLQRAVQDLVRGMAPAGQLSGVMEHKAPFVRLVVLQGHLDQGRMDGNLNWQLQ